MGAESGDGSEKKIKPLEFVGGLALAFMFWVPELIGKVFEPLSKLAEPLLDATLGRIIPVEKPQSRRQRRKVKRESQ